MFWNAKQVHVRDHLCFNSWFTCTWKVTDFSLAVLTLETSFKNAKWTFPNRRQLEPWCMPCSTNKKFHSLSACKLSFTMYVFFIHNMDLLIGVDQPGACGFLLLMLLEPCRLQEAPLHPSPPCQSPTQPVTSLMWSCTGQRNATPWTRLTGGMFFPHNVKKKNRLILVVRCRCYTQIQK